MLIVKSTWLYYFASITVFGFYLMDVVYNVCVTHVFKCHNSYRYQCMLTVNFINRFGYRLRDIIINKSYTSTITKN